MAKLTRKQLYCPYCWDGEMDFGAVEFKDGGSVCFAILTGDHAAIECVVYDSDHEIDKIHGVEIEYCPWCGRKLT